MAGFHESTVKIMDKVLISVITVCLNAEKEIEYTIRSVSDQKCADYEYLIVDGGSADSTLSIAEGYSDRFSGKNISYRIISQKDKGIYDAMNKAAGYATGEWILYLNAGDTLFDENVLDDLTSDISDKTDVIYGDTLLMEDNKYKLLKAESTEAFAFCNPICHQASMVRKNIVQNFSFDTGYKIASDYDFFLRVYLTGEYGFKKADRVFCIYPMSGISSTCVTEREKEFNLSRKKNGLKRVAFPHILILKNRLIYSIRKTAVGIMGSRFYSEKRGWYSDGFRAAGLGETDA